MKRETIIRSAVALLLAAAIAACSGGGKQAEETEQEALPKVKLGAAVREEVEQVETYTATVEAQVTNNIAPSMPVRIERINVEVGDRVSRGQALVQMDAASLRQQQLQMENLRADFRRIDELYKVGGVSRSQWEASKTSLDVSETAYRNLQRNTTLTSPISGVVTARNYDNGDMYNGAQPVLTVAQIQPVKLVINVSESQFTRITKGTKAEVELDVYPGETFEGTINLIHPTVNAATRTFAAEVRLPNADQRVRPGMFGRVKLNLGKTERIVVPDKAIIKQAGSGERYVYVCRDGRVLRRTVELGRRLGDRYELLSGLDGEADVVVDGQYQSAVKDSAQVEVVKN